MADTILCDTIWTDAALLTMVDGAGSSDLITNGTVAAKDGRIVYAGPSEGARALRADVMHSCEGRLLTPGLIDCHTHLVYAGSRAGEWEARLAGASYEDVARSGGGIVATMRATRSAEEAELIAQSRPRLRALVEGGVTTVEIKSGYGLELASERRMLRAAKALGQECGVRVLTTFLGAHAVPPEYSNRSDDYITLITNEMLPVLAREGLVDAVDAFCEGIGFTLVQTERVMAAARRLGLPVKLHAEQLSNLHGATLAARYGALSADHLEYLDATGIAAMARSGTVATLLPGAFYFTHETKVPPIDALRQAEVPIALATDCNPGTSPLTSLLLAMNMGATLFGLNIDECLAGVTRNAARALGLQAETGTLIAGKSCDLAIWDVERPAELVYRIGLNPLHARVWKGL